MSRDEYLTSFQFQVKITERAIISRLPRCRERKTILQSIYQGVRYLWQKMRENCLGQIAFFAGVGPLWSRGRECTVPRHQRRQCPLRVGQGRCWRQSSSPPGLCSPCRKAPGWRRCLPRQGRRQRYYNFSFGIESSVQGNVCWFMKLVFKNLFFISGGTQKSLEQILKTFLELFR